MTAHGLLLAAGAGTRMGRPKALVADERGPWLPRAVAALLAGGCDGVTVVLGAAAEEAEALLWSAVDAEVSPIPALSRRVGERSTPRSVAGEGEVTTGLTTVVAADWADGMSASLRAGLSAPGLTGADAALLHLVDLPDVGPEVVRRVLAEGAGPTALRRAAYAGRPGHPVLLGRDHWPGVLDASAGDEGARTYLRAHPAELVECGDLASGGDVDRLDQPGANHPPD